MQPGEHQRRAAQHARVGRDRLLAWSFNFFVLASRYMNKIWVFKRKQRTREREWRGIIIIFLIYSCQTKTRFVCALTKTLRAVAAVARAFSLISIIMRAENKGILSTSNTRAPAARKRERLQVFEWSGARRTVRMRGFGVPSFCQTEILCANSHESLLKATRKCRLKF